jgi:hypothetical protein
MAKATRHIADTLVTLVVSLRLSDEVRARELAKSLDAKSAKQLIVFLQDSSVGRTKNLEGGEGGFLAGLQNIVESEKLDTREVLPRDPRRFTKKQKLSVIKKFDAKNRQSDAKLAQGLKLILAEKRENRKSDLSNWKYELSDPDFPIVVAKVDEKAKNLDKKIIRDLDDILKQSRADVSKAARAHKDHTPPKKKR